MRFVKSYITARGLGDIHLILEDEGLHYSQQKSTGPFFVYNGRSTTVTVTPQGKENEITIVGEEEVYREIEKAIPPYLS